MSKVEQEIKKSDDHAEDCISPEKTLPKNADCSRTKFDDLDIGWAWVVLAGSFGTFCLMGATQNASGIVNIILLDRYQASVMVTSITGALHMSLISFAAPISTFVIERYSCRMSIVFSGGLLFLGYLWTAFAPRIEFVILTYGIVAGVGGGLGNAASLIVVSYYFQSKRNVAMGLAVAGSGIGTCFLAPLMDFLYHQYGSFGFFFLMSGIFAQNIIFGMLSFPSKLELYTKSQQSDRQITTNNQTLCNFCRSYLPLLRNKAILCLAFGMFNFCLGTYLLYLHLPNYLLGKGFSSSVAANLMSLMGILIAVGRILTGIMATIKCFREDILYCLPMFMLGIMTIILPNISNTFAGNLAFVIFVGSLSGNVYTLLASVLVKHAGIANVAKAIGLMYFCAGIGVLSGPLLAGILVDEGGSYDGSFYTAGTCILFGGLSSGAASFVSKCEIKITENNDKIVALSNLTCIQHENKNDIKH